MADPKLLTASALATTVASLAMSPATAQAQSFLDNLNGFPTADVGAYVSLTFGGGERHVGFGLQGRVAMTEDLCASALPAYYGAVGRIDFRGMDNPRLLVGVQYGRILGFLASANAEVGVGYRLGVDPGLEVTAGAGATGLFIGHAHFDVDTISGFTTVGLGLGSPFPLGTGCVVEGRPLRSAEGFVPLPEVSVLDAGRKTEIPARAAAAASVWAQRAQTEWASVPTFIHLAEQLELVGAPNELIHSALRAADDETRHALMSAGVLADVLGGVVSLDPVSPDVRPHMLGRAALVRLATESWIDGCVGEGIAAAFAARELEDAVDPLVRMTQQHIAVEEREHAELAWNIVRWCLSVGGDEVRDAVLAQRRARPSAEELDTRESEHDLRDFGYMGERERAHVFETASAEAESRLDAVL